MIRHARTIALAAAMATVACTGGESAGPPRASGYVEATEVRVASQVPGRVETVQVVEGARVEAGATIATIATTDLDLALDRVRADRAQMVAQLRLLEAGARPEEIEQARAQAAAARGERAAAQAERDAAAADAERFEQLLRNRAGSAKQRDDAVARRELASARLEAANDRVAAAAAALARLEAGARAEELAAARARIAAVDAQIAALAQDRREATVAAPLAGVVTSRLVEPGELVGVGTPLAVIIDLDHAWANVYVEEPLVPALRLGQPAAVLTDAGDRLAGTIAVISPRAEFTPRNVQTADERARLVYRVKVTVDNRDGILKPGMPVVAEFQP